MPAKKSLSQQKSEQNSPKRVRLNMKTSDQKPSSNSKKRRIVIASVVVLVVGGFVWWTFGGGSTLGVQNSLESYLKDKYDKDFVVGRPRLQGTGLGVTGQWEANAHPKDDSTLQFMVGKDQVSDRYFDQYDDNVWKREETQKIEAYLKQLFGEVPKYELVTNLDNNGGPDAIKGSVPSVDTAIEQYSDTFLYSLSVKFTAKTLKDEQIKADIRSKFIRLEDYIKGRGVKKLYLSFLISATDDNAGYLCSTENISRLGSLDGVLNNCLNIASKKGVY